MSVKNAPRGSKRQIINTENKTELDGLKAFYLKLAGPNPALNVNANPTKEQLWAAIIAVANKMPDPLHFAVGTNTSAGGSNAFAQGQGGNASGQYSHAEGYNTIASGYASHAEGSVTTASGDSTHTEGYGCVASGSSAHAEGGSCNATASGAHAEGGSCNATNTQAHAEGYQTTASGARSHSEGRGTVASGEYSHAQNKYALASGIASHAEGAYNLASGEASHAGGKSAGTTNRSESEGLSSFIHQEVTTGIKKSLADNSAILGGKNNSTASTALRSVVLGGDGQNATLPDAVYMHQIKLKPLATLPTGLGAADAGLIVFDDVAKVFKGWSGTAWLTF